MLNTGIFTVMVDLIQQWQNFNYNSFPVCMGLDQATIYWLEQFWNEQFVFHLKSATSTRDEKDGKVRLRAWQTILFTHISVLNQSLAGCVPTKKETEFD